MLDGLRPVAPLLLTGKNPSLPLVLVTTMVVVDTVEKLMMRSVICTKQCGRRAHVVVWISVMPARVVVRTLVATDEMTFVIVLAGSDTVTVTSPDAEDVVEDGLVSVPLDVVVCEVPVESVELVEPVVPPELVVPVPDVEVEESPDVVVDEEIDDSAELELGTGSGFAEPSQGWVFGGEDACGRSCMGLKSEVHGLPNGLGFVILMGIGVIEKNELPLITEPS